MHIEPIDGSFARAVRGLPLWEPVGDGDAICSGRDALGPYVAFWGPRTNRPGSSPVSSPSTCTGTPETIVAS